MYDAPMSQLATVIQQSMYYVRWHLLQQQAGED
jgi:hypothetical protein